MCCSNRSARAARDGARNEEQASHNEQDDAYVDANPAHPPPAPPPPPSQHMTTSPTLPSRTLHSLKFRRQKVLVMCKLNPRCWTRSRIHSAHQPRRRTPRLAQCYPLVMTSHMLLSPMLYSTPYTSNMESQNMHIMSISRKWNKHMQEQHLWDTCRPTRTVSSACMVCTLCLPRLPSLLVSFPCVLWCLMFVPMFALVVLQRAAEFLTQSVPEQRPNVPVSQPWHETVWDAYDVHGVCT